ncbi:MAG: hypothetical protein HN348_26030, partial [Proteobacteria bacterium]|nr:hypothetical protein [Pseudomonadota bacterium]
IANWQASIRPKLELALKDLRQEIAGDARDFDDVSSAIVTDFVGESIALPHDTSTDQGDVDRAERWFSVALGAVLLSPGAMAAGWAQGYEGALKGAASRLGVRIALLTFGALIGPVGWLGLLLYVVSDAVLLGLTGGKELRRLRSQVGQNLQGRLVVEADKGKEEVLKRIAEGLQPLRDGLTEAAEAETTELRDLLQRTIAAREEAVASATARQTEWDGALSRVSEGLKELEELAQIEKLHETE